VTSRLCPLILRKPLPRRSVSMTFSVSSVLEKASIPQGGITEFSGISVVRLARHGEHGGSCFGVRLNGPRRVEAFLFTEDTEQGIDIEVTGDLPGTGAKAGPDVTAMRAVEVTVVVRDQ
jgi:hypothetical protein